MEDRLASQRDVAVEFGILEDAFPSCWSGRAATVEQLVDRRIRLRNTGRERSEARTIQWAAMAGGESRRRLRQ
jgi:hypothetical protein